METVTEKNGTLHYYKESRNVVTENMKNNHKGSKTKGMRGKG